MMALMPANCWNAKMRQLMTTDLVVSNLNRPGLRGAAALPGELARPASRSQQTLQHACQDHKPAHAIHKRHC